MSNYCPYCDNETKGSKFPCDDCRRKVKVWQASNDGVADMAEEYVQKKIDEVFGSVTDGKEVKE